MQRGPLNPLSVRDNQSRFAFKACSRSPPSIYPIADHMHTPDLHRIRASFAWFSPCGPALIAQAVRLAADRDDDIRSLLPENQEHLNTLLFRTLGHIVKHADNFALLEAQMATVASRAAKAGVRPKQLPLMRDSLLAALGALAGEQWTPALARDWETLLDAIMGTMLAAPSVTRQAA